MSEHAPLAPSAAHRWMSCPGSHALVERTPADKRPPDDSVYSREGTFAHTIAARCLQDGTDASVLIGETDGEFTLDAAMAAQVQTYLDVVREILFLEGGDLHIEKRVYFTGQIYGTADTIIVVRPRMHVVDLKFGAGVYVPAHGNEQLMIYALGALTLLGEGVDEIVLHIVQPRHSAAEAHRMHTITADEIYDFAERVEKAAEIALEGTGPLVSGEHCQFCPAKLVCPQLAKDADLAAAEVFSRPAVVPPAPETLTVDAIARVLALRPAVSTWLKGIEEYAERILAAGGVIPGFELRASKGHRKWIDETAARETLELFDVHPFAPPKLITPAQAEKADRKLRRVIATLTQTPISGYKIVPAGASAVDAEAFLDG